MNKNRREQPVLTCCEKQMRLTRPAVFVVIAVLVIACLFSAGYTHAFAEENDVYDQVSEAQSELERTALAYDEAKQALDEIESNIAANEARAEELSQRIPAQQSKSNAALTALYKMQNESDSLVVMLLSSESFGDLLLNMNYLSVFYDSNIKEVNSLLAMKAELDEVSVNLEEEHAAASQEEQLAKTALEQAQAAREAAQAAAEAQRKAEEEAAAAAAEAAAAEAAAQEQEAHDASSNASSQESDSLSGGETSADPGSDNADWTLDKSEFVAQWAERLDAYLAGSPLEGYGETFAAAAWAYGVDPRFSPAISCVESSKGLYCFRDHNAWGWGSVDWDSWEEAIDAHVKGLARGYGYTVTISGAKKYCPPNWQYWYSRVCAEMAKI